MTPYNEADLTNIELQQFAGKALRSNLITKDEFSKISIEHPVRFYTPNIFLRIGLGFLTLVVSSAIIGLIILITDADELEPILLFMGIASIGTLELVIRKWKHYRSGIDDVLLHTGIIYLLAFFSMKFVSAQEIVLSAIALFLYSIASLRYLDRLAALLVVSSLVSFIYYTTNQWNDQPSTLVLFIISAMTALTAAIVHLLQKKPFFIYQVQVLQLVKYAAIIACYGSLHYYIAEQYLQEHTAAATSPNKPVFLAWFYWIWTIIIPPAILYYGLLKRQRPWIRIGIALIVAFFFFWQYEFHPVDHELAALLYGILLVVLAYFIIKYLKTRKSVFTDEVEQGESGWEWSESIAIAAGFSGQASAGATHEGPGPNFGGGNFGGGGAGSEF